MCLLTSWLRNRFVSTHHALVKILLRSLKISPAQRASISSNIQTQCPWWSGAWRHRFHRTDYYTGPTAMHYTGFDPLLYTIQVLTDYSTLHRFQSRTDYALVKLCLSWMPLRPAAFCAIAACSIIAAALHMKWKEQFHRIHPHIKH